MRILFIQPSSGFLMRGTTYPVCRSIMVTASFMKSLDYDVMVYDRCVDFRRPEEVVDSFKPDFVMLYLTPTASVKDAINLSCVSKNNGAVVVWGEVVAACFSEQIVKNGYADFVITGETESKLLSLVTQYDSKDFRNIPGLTYLKENDVICNANENNVELENLPQIDWDLIDVKKCFRQFPHCKKMLYMYTSRGCPFKCAYCYNTMFYNSQHRKRSIKYVLNEIKYLEESYGLDGANFSDELLLLTDEEITEIKEFREKNNLRFFWGGETRADVYDDIDKLKRMYDAGCRWFLLGIETGSEITRKQINKPMDQQQIKRFVDKCTDVGITTFGSFIIGFPDETPEQLKETAQYALSLNLDAFLFNYYIAIPKTPLCDKMITEGKFVVGEMSDQISASRQVQNLCQNYSDIPQKELLVVKSYFDWLTFTRRKKESQQKSMFIQKAFDSLMHFAEGGIKNTVRNVFDAGKTFFSVLFYSHAYPKIIKKYGLYNVNRKK